MLDLKAWIAKVTAWINGVGFGTPTDYSSALYSATQASPWTAPKSGMMVIYSGTSNGVRAYWYITDKTTGFGVARATRLETATYQLGTSFPVIKGHEYYTQQSGLLSNDYHATLYPIVGG